jgi:hypothetical protein
MYLYNITCRVENKIFESWQSWVLENKIPALMASGFFSGYRFCALLGEELTDARTFALQFHCDSREALQKFQNGAKGEFLEQQSSLFGEDVLTFSSLLQIHSEG